VNGMKNISIIGSTGSIGRQTLAVIEALGSEYRVVALTAESSDQLLAEQVIKFNPEIAVINDQSAAARLEKAIKTEKCQVLTGAKGQLTAATLPAADLIVIATVGFSGFEPLLAALNAGKKVALANKESLVVGGEILKDLGLLNGTNIMPIDSEHSAIWQCLGTSAAPVRRLLLTASGGPFFGLNYQDLKNVTPKMALAHPNWSMGAKITIDSATMMNKGLEVIEAKWLFGFSLRQIEVVVHRQSIIHSMVEYIDGSVIAQLGLPDMRLPIQYALTYPDRVESRVAQYDPFGHTLSFDRPDTENFPCLNLAYQAASIGGTMPAVLNGANEIAVDSFLKEKIRFVDIPEVIDAVMQSHILVSSPAIEDVVSADDWSRLEAAKVITRLIGEVN
jgi:1-deoxy-D-xylulose-5-phosphate reductoisomerase